MLLIEDNAIALKMIENLLQQLGIRFLSAPTGTRAMELFQSHTFDWILSDIGLPDTTGIHLAKQFRQYEQSQNLTPTPIICLTAHAVADVENECVQAGINQVITKPLRSSMLQALLARYSTSKVQIHDVPAAEVEPILPFNEYPLFDSTQVVV